jgi:GNAT superfamily N-acetyltransferase
MRTEVNPPWLAPGDYVAFLDRVFPGQWDLRAYDWYIARGFNSRHGDLLVQAEEGRIRAGIALVPRQVVVDDRAPIDVGILGAAGTLPEERARGRYAQLLETAIECGRQRGYAALLAYTTADNASSRGLLRIGARAIPSFYVFSAGRTPGVPRAAATMRVALDDVVPQLNGWRPHPRLTSGAATARFHYADRGDWEQQFLHRPNGVRAARIRHDSLALLESVDSTDRLQYLACPEEKRVASVAALAAASRASGRRFFMYTLEPSEAAAARRLGLRTRDGHLLLLPTGRGKRHWEALTAAHWHVQSGDRL